MARRHVTANRIADLSSFYVGYYAFYRWAMEQAVAFGEARGRGETTEEFDPDPFVKHLAAGEPLIKRFSESMTEGLGDWEELVGKSFPALKAPFKQALRQGAPTEVAKRQTEFLTRFLPRLRSKAQVMRGLFEGRGYRAIMAVAAAVESDSPMETLHKCAGISPVSGVQILRKWLEEAANMAGVPVSELDSVSADVGAATEMGKKLGKVKNSIDAIDPTSAQAVDLQQKRQAIEGDINTMIDTSKDPATVKAAAATAIASTYQHSTEIGKRLGHTPDQEEAMVATGRTIIAAGAGSGKTRVLASKVAWHISEGIPASAIMATSFTRKSSAELIRRVEAYGGVIPENARDGFGTTHSIAGKMLNRNAREYRRPNGYIGKKEGWKQVTLLRLAMKQVSLKGGSAAAAPPPVGFWDNASVPDAAASDPAFLDAIDKARDYYGWISSQSWARGPKWKHLPGYLQFLRDMAQRKTPNDLTADEKKLLNKMLTKAKSYGRPVTYRVAADAQEGESNEREAKRSTKMEDYTFWARPAGEWFNLGIKMEDEDGKPLPLGGFKNYISITKGKGISPSQAWQGEGGGRANSSEAAVYAAYEWMKGSNGEPQFQSTGDMDDILIDTVTALVANPQLRAGVQNRYKVILVDEAQDLNRVQHLLFGLMAGNTDPVTLEPNTDKSMTADTFALIGDDKQCVDVNAMIRTPKGECPAGELRPGDAVLSYRNGKVVAQVVRHVVPSPWEYGRRITTESGNTLLMSPNHRLWATDPQTEGAQHIVYLMHRKDLGFRVGITNKGKVGSDGDYLNSFGGRCFLEKAEKFWVLDITESRDEALTLEAQYSLRYQIPTQVFNGEHRDVNQERAETLFAEFGHNGMRLLEERHLSLDLPHWMSQSYTKHGRERHTINLIAHSGSSSQVSMEWTGDKFDAALEGMGVRTAPEDRRRLRKYFSNYREALAFADEVARRTEAQISHRLSAPEGALREIPASGLFAGMSVPILEGESVGLDPIISIEQVGGKFVDLDVDDASNFFANGILTHNSIYEFRGADPDEFINKSNLTEGGDDFSTHLLKVNFRSGEAIVNSANKLIAHNKKQIPMTCEANVDVKGQGAIVSSFSESTEDAAKNVAQEVEAMMSEGLVPEYDKKAGTGGYSSFGVALRSNAEAYAYGIELLIRGIPFKSNARFFNDKNSKALIGWLTIAENGLTGSASLVNPAVLDALGVPFTKLSGKTVGDKLAGVKGNWAAWLQDPVNQRRIYNYRNVRERLAAFAHNLSLAAKFSGSPDQILGEVMQLRGIDGSTVQEGLVNTVRDDADTMAELTAEAENGIVTGEQIEEMAMAPIRPLLTLMEGKEDLDEAMGFIRKLQKVNAKISSKDTDEEIDRNAVTIGTMHSWKGLECSNMYVPMVGGKFPRVGKDKDTAEEGPALWSERRLAYVAITRAEDRCVILDIPNPKTGATSQFILEACVPMEGMPPEDDKATVKTGAGYNLNELLRSIELLPEPEDVEGTSLEEMWGDTMGVPE